MCPDKHKFIGVVIVVEVYATFFNIFQNLNCKGRKKKKTKVTRKKIQGNKIQQKKIRKYVHLFSLF